MSHTLADFARRPEVRSILESPVTSTGAVARLAEIGVPTSRSAVKRWRARYSPEHPLVGAANAEVLSSPYSPGAKAPPPPRGRHPSVGTASVEADYVAGTGEITTAPVEAGQYEDLDDTELLEEFGFDPSIRTITTARRSFWQQREGGEWLDSKRISVRRRDTLTDAFTADELEGILARYPSRPGIREPGKRILCVPIRRHPGRQARRWWEPGPCRALRGSCGSGSTGMATRISPTPMTGVGGRVTRARRR
jgi:hypothetical protein